jgi:hypothetical protein
MSEFRTLEYLLDKVGFTEEEARAAMQDDDLWINPPSLRLELSGEEAVEEWRQTSYALDALGEVAQSIGPGTVVALTDAQRRVDIALERARERVSGAYQEG